jgi:hypothetical protein
MREFRAEKRAKRAAKSEERDASISQKGDESEDEDESENENKEEADAADRRKGWNARTAETQTRDMYKSMDGGALVVIGVCGEPLLTSTNVDCLRPRAASSTQRRSKTF